MLRTTVELFRYLEHLEIQFVSLSLSLFFYVANNKASLQQETLRHRQEEIALTRNSHSRELQALLPLLPPVTGPPPQSVTKTAKKKSYLPTKSSVIKPQVSVESSKPENTPIVSPSIQRKPTKRTDTPTLEEEEDDDTVVEEEAYSVVAINSVTIHNLTP